MQSIRFKLGACAAALVMAGAACAAPNYTDEPKVTSLKAVPTKIMVVGNSYS